MHEKAVLEPACSVLTRQRLVKGAMALEICYEFPDVLRMPAQAMGTFSATQLLTEGSLQGLT